MFVLTRSAIRLTLIRNSIASQLAIEGFQGRIHRCEMHNKLTKVTLDKSIALLIAMYESHTARTKSYVELHFLWL